MSTIRYEAVTDSAGRLVIDPATGQPRITTTCDPLPGEQIGHTCWTGAKARGVVTMSDGTLYDLTPPVIQISERHVGDAIGFRIAERLAEHDELTGIVHGDGYDGPACIVVGDEGGFRIAHVGENLEAQPTAEAAPAADG